VSIPLERLQAELGGVVIGADTPYTLSNIDGLGLGNLRTRTVDIPGEDGEWFGREYRQAPVLTFEGQVVKAGDEAGAWDLSDVLEDAFDMPELRKTARAVTPLRLRRPGSDARILYGRPDRYDPAHRMAVVGLVPFMATFRGSDPRWFSDAEESVTLAMSAVSAGGLITTVDGSIPSPITTVAGERRSSIITNDGNRETPAIITFRGPLSGGKVSLLDSEGGVLWEVGLTKPIAYDRIATVDTRPWKREVRLGDGSALGSPLTPQSVLSRCTIPPGQSEILIEGVDLTGTARFEIRWRHAYRRP